ncbi:MAG TPA: DUF2785 domain-containing protein [Bdellovibrio sp.]|nr:DUF2785 domain-containing protein [Bdellovibrio sp.]
MNTRESLQQLHDRVQKNDRTLGHPEFTAQLPQLLEVLGHKDPEIRDVYGASFFSKYFRSTLFPPAMRGEILELLSSSEFLFFEIERGATEATLKRSFAALAISDILIGELQNGPAIHSNELVQLADKLCFYLQNETDWRGRDAKLGWVHSVAHVSDAFWVLAMHPLVDEQIKEKCFFALINLIKSRGNQVFEYQEDFRLGRALSVLLESFNDNFVRKIFETDFSREKIFKLSCCQNLLTTLRCVYLDLSVNAPQREALLSILKKIIL